MKIRPVIKVMNFHALLRVDSSRRKAQKYSAMQDSLEDMMQDIMENQNLKLDKLISLPSKKLPKLVIYIGSDLGFCGSLNSSEKKMMGSGSDSDTKIVIGKRIRSSDAALFILREEFDQCFDEISEYLREAVSGKKYSKVELVYNKYYNSGLIKPEQRVIYPPSLDEEKSRSGDFVLEGGAEELIRDMLISYLEYEIKIAVISSYASENILRQNATTESLKKLDEIESEEQRIMRKERNAASFKASIDSAVKQKALQEKL